jgi:hypothetical protein
MQLTTQLLDSMSVLDQCYRISCVNPITFCKQLGTDAVALFTLHAACNQLRVQALLHDGQTVNDTNGVQIPGVVLTAGADPTLAASYVPQLPPGYTFVYNQDGTVTATKT